MLNILFTVASSLAYKTRILWYILYIVVCNLFLWQTITWGNDLLTHRKSKKLYIWCTFWSFVKRGMFEVMKISEILTFWMTLTHPDTYKGPICWITLTQVKKNVFSHDYSNLKIFILAHILVHLQHPTARAPYIYIYIYIFVSSEKSIFTCLFIFLIKYMKWWGEQLSNGG